MIGNGFIGMLSEKGIMYSLDYSDNITLLYSKFEIYSIAISNNQLFSLCKDKNDSNSLYLCRWEPSPEKQSNDSSETWTTHIYSVKEEFCKDNDLYFYSYKNTDFLLILQCKILIIKDNAKITRNENVLGRSMMICKAIDKSVDITSTKFSESWSAINELEGMNNTNVLTYMNMYDDSYNTSYKRIKNVEGIKVIL